MENEFRPRGLGQPDSMKAQQQTPGPVPSQPVQPQVTGYGPQPRPGYGSPIGASPQPQNSQVPQQPASYATYTTPQAPQPAVPQKTNTLALLGLVLTFFMPLVGLVLSIIGLNQIKKGEGSGKKFAVAGIVVSSIWIALTPLFIYASILMLP